MSLNKQFQTTKPGDVGIMGDPIEHSLSPVMQNAAFRMWKMAFLDRELAVPTYHKFHVTENELPRAVELAKRHELKGFNVTIPHKVAIGAHIQKWDSFAKKVGAINTVLIDQGSLKGFNTDGDGFRRAVERDLDFDAEGKKIFVLGAGGTGRVIVHQLLIMGARHIFIWNRHAAKIQEIKEGVENAVEMISSVETADEIKRALNESDLVVNSTAAGLKDPDELPIEGLFFRTGQVAFDVIYHHETAFVKKAQADRARALGGESMLLHQGARAFEIWTGSPAPVEAMKEILFKTIKGHK